MNISRRRFLLSTAVVGGGFIIGYAATRPSRHRIANDTLAASGQHYITAWLRIDADNRVTVYVPHSDMGQGIFNSLSMMAADEMDANWELVTAEQAPATDLFANGELISGFASEFGVPSFLHGIIGASALKVAQLVNVQATGGSSSVRFTGEIAMRNAGAAARQMLIECAAQRWDVPADECYTKLSYVHHNASGSSFSYGELAADAAQMEPPEKPTLKNPSEFNIMGKALSRADIPIKVNGTAKYGIDAFSKDMLFAAIRISPVFGAKLVSVDATEALSRRGIKRVIKLKDSVAVVADNYWRAKEALNRVTTEFEQTGNEQVNSTDIFAQFDHDLAAGSGKKILERGDAKKAMDEAKGTIEAGYRVPFLAHATMEPMNCTVHFHDGKADVWTSTQDNLGIRGRVASIGNLDENDVTMHPVYLGGGFGRRLPFNWNMIDHATLIAKGFDVPVKTIFSREDDIQQDYYRPAVSSNLRAAFDAAGNVTTWENRFTGPIMGPGAAHIPYAIPNQSIRYVNSRTHVPVAAWRSVDHSQHTFFTESFIDEIAQYSGKNPYNFRMELLAEHPRHRKVLEVAAASAGYGQDLPDGHAMGIAVQESFGSIVAEIAEVSIGNNGQLRVHKVTCAIDCGRAINPDTVEQQVESGIIFGLSAALYGEITIKNGRVVQNNFPDYNMIRMAQTPEIQVHIVESGEALGGLGEPATPPIAAAVTNAIYILTGQRIRELPIMNHNLTRSAPVAQR
ncbi:MAG: xanthine dehydrogenase family protein molybdopterin-binding subunit [Gammaproteobacteria bacterium]|nr:xanthine dehydrogenase family protein molybdopterin-binding subunit [Gammaproteobacteria bacterium]